MGKLLSDFEKKLAIKGVVKCRCGGMIIDRDGRAQMSAFSTACRLKCFRCNRTWDLDVVLDAREDGKIVKLQRINGLIIRKIVSDSLK